MMQDEQGNGEGGCQLRHSVVYACCVHRAPGRPRTRGVRKVFSVHHRGAGGHSLCVFPCLLRKTKKCVKKQGSCLHGGWAKGHKQRGKSS